MNFYKFFILLLSFLLFSCSATEEASTESTDTTSSTTSITIESQDNQGDDDFDYDIALGNFENYWETLLKENNPLTFEELALTYNLNELMNEDFNWDEGTGAYFYLNEATCYEKVRGTVPGGYLDENHPIGLTDPEAYFPSSFWGFCGNDSSEELISTFGNPFFQDGTWWTFASTKAYSSALKECKKLYGTCIYPGSFDFATRVNIEIPNDYIVGTDGPFNEYWTNNKLKNTSPLTNEELQLSNQINQNPISNLTLEDGTHCVRKIGGTLTSARLDEINPLEIKEEGEWGFLALQSYSCSDQNRPGRLFGDFFYQDGTWWIFVEQSEEEIDIDDPWERMSLNVWKFATRTNLGSDIFEGNYTCRADADYIEAMYDLGKLDRYNHYKDKEIDYSQPTTLEDLNSRIELLKDIKDHYKSAIGLRVGYRMADEDDLDPENSYIDAVLYGLYVNIQDSIYAYSQMAEHLEENGPFATNADETNWWRYNSQYSAVEWRSTDESTEFIRSKLEPGDDYGNHIVEGYTEPSTPWILSDDYPRETLRNKCNN